MPWEPAEMPEERRMELITHVIDGEDVESESGARFESVDPYTRAAYAEVDLVP